MSDDWNVTEKIDPPENEVVSVMDSGGHVQELKKRGNLWWFPDDSMYVYFVPKMWKSLK